MLAKHHHLARSEGLERAREPTLEERLASGERGLPLELVLPYALGQKQLRPPSKRKVSQHN